MGGYLFNGVKMMGPSIIIQFANGHQVEITKDSIRLPDAIFYPREIQFIQTITLLLVNFNRTYENTKEESK